MRAFFCCSHSRCHTSRLQQSVVIADEFSIICSDFGQYPSIQVSERSRVEEGGDADLLMQLFTQIRGAAKRSAAGFGAD